MVEVCQRPLFVLEDSDEDFDTLCEATRAAGLPNAIHRFTTGEACLARLRATEVPPAVVLLDLSTPGLDGRQTLREIKRDPRLRELLVVILTTSSNPRDIASCYGAGANAYHVKPVRYMDHLQVLLDLFAYWMEQVILPRSEGTLS